EPQSSGLRGWPLLHRPMIPAVRPAPLSAWMLLGTMIAYPHPLAITSSCHDGPRAGPNGPPPPLVSAFFITAFLAAAPGPPGRGPKPPKPKSIITGTGPVASAGVVSVNWMSTVISGYDELSTCPTSRLVMTGLSPTLSLVVAVTSHFTPGV